MKREEYIREMLKQDMDAEESAASGGIGGLAGSVSDSKRMDWLCRMHVEVRTPVLYGSRKRWTAQCVSDEEDEVYQTTLRGQIDAEIFKEKQNAAISGEKGKL